MQTFYLKIKNKFTIKNKFAEIFLKCDNFKKRFIENSRLYDLIAWDKVSDNEGLLYRTLILNFTEYVFLEKCFR